MRRKEGEGGGGRRKRGEGVAGCSYLPVPAETVARHPVCRRRRKMKSVHTITALTNRTVVAGLIPALHPAPALSNNFIPRPCPAYCHSFDFVFMHVERAREQG